MRLACLRAEIATVAWHERNALERNAAALQRVGNRAERASGKARAFVHDDVVGTGRDRLGRKIHLAGEGISKRPDGERRRRVERCRNDRSEGRPNAADSDDPRRT